MYGVSGSESIDVITRRSMNFIPWKIRFLIARNDPIPATPNGKEDYSPGWIRNEKQETGF